MSFRYLFEFRALDSFSFSGETSARTHDVTDNAFLGDNPNATRRQSFRVKTDVMPPQTTVMGAVRRLLLTAGLGIGENSFDLSKDEEQVMGDIKSISPIFLMGEDREHPGDREFVCIPAPAAVKRSKMEPGYIPAIPEKYDPKESPLNSWLIYRKDDLTRPIKLKENDGLFYSNDAFFKQYEQAVVHIGEKSKGDSYHLQCRCRFTKQTLNDLRFCVVAELSKSISGDLEPMLISLGSKDSRFQATCREAEMDVLSACLPNIYEEGTKYWCVSLLSASHLHENWLTDGKLKWAYVDKRNIRCAISDKDYKLTLIPQKMTFADKGSVFLFDNEDDRNNFANAIEANHRSICGLNRVLRYEIGSDVTNE